MLPELFDLGPVTVYSFGVMVALSFIVPLPLLRRGIIERGHKGDIAIDFALAAAVGGIVGARVWFLVENRDEVEVVANAFDGDGLTWYGGVIGGAVAVLAVGRIVHKMRLAEIADSFAAPLAFGQAIGRIGCELSGDGDYGRQTDAPLPFAHAYPKGTVPTDDRVWATPPMETIALAIIGLVLWRLRHRLPTGGLIALYLLLTGLERFLIEFIRRNPDTVGPLTTPQVVALIGMAVGGAWLAALRTRGAPSRPAHAA